MLLLELKPLILFKDSKPVSSSVGCTRQYQLNVNEQGKINTHCVMCALVNFSTQLNRSPEVKTLPQLAHGNQQLSMVGRAIWSLLPSKLSHLAEQHKVLSRGRTFEDTSLADNAGRSPDIKCDLRQADWQGTPLCISLNAKPGAFNLFRNYLDSWLQEQWLRIRFKS